MELVRTVQRAHQRSTSTRQTRPLFPSELIGPARHAILRARQFLLGEQREDGSWLGYQTTDASLASQFLLTLAYLGQEESEPAQHVAATIIQQQLPCGGWSLMPNGPPVVSTSVQAYFALKLAGFDPGDERLHRARQVIRQLGGADAADETTRSFLALLGQIDYDCCPAMPPELYFVNGQEPRRRVPLSIIWSHRPVRKVGIERGVRELFVNKPSDWPTQLPGPNGSRPKKSSTRIHLLFAAFLRQCERRGWTPLRTSALEWAESQLLDHIRPERMAQLDFSELLCHMIALHALGYPDDGAERCACSARIDEMICPDDGGHASPRLRAEPRSDTAIALRGLRVSGIGLTHPSVSDGLEWLCQSRTFDAPLHETDLGSIVAALAGAASDEVETSDALPPDIGFSCEHWSATEDNDTGRLTRIQRSADKLHACASAQLRFEQRPGGALLEAIAEVDCENPTPDVQRAIEYVRQAQRADGSWDDVTGRSVIQATSEAILGLSAVGTPKDDEAITAGVNWLVVHQQPSGGWGEAAALPQTRVDDQSLEPARPTASHTAWALRALVAAGRANNLAARRAVQFLVETQQDDGRWHEPDFATRDSATGRWYRNELHSVAWPLMALSQWAVAAASGQDITAESTSLRLVNVSSDS
ncbi:MAG: prenyltransferase/squalene oxidase repeat-containing protein [Pirellulales bacterium]